MRRLPSALAAIALLGGAATATPQLPSVGQPAFALAEPAEMRIGVLAQGAYTVRTIPLEAYVAGVLVGEAARESAPAALDTLAIAIRTYAMRNLRRHDAEGFDLCDQTHCQVLRAPTEVTGQSVARTTGQVLTYQGGLAAVFYSASCGGRTEIPSAVWPGEVDAPYMPSQLDDACEGQPVWSAQLKTGDVARALELGGFRGALRDLRIVSYHPSGRVDRLDVDGLTPPQLTGQDLRMIVGSQIGWQYIKSTAFELERSADGFVFSGRGYGHGVGLCVIGSTRLAEAGQPAPSILARYFPGAMIGVLASRELGAPVATTTAARTIGPVPPPAVAPAVSAPLVRAADRPAPLPGPAATSAPAAAVPDEAARARQEIERLTTRARQEIAATLSVPAASAIALRLHPTTAAYQEHTGLPWYTFGAYRQGEVHLAPLTLLRERGVLERIVRREVTHALIDAELSHRPQWVRDGAALYFAEPTRETTDPRAACPSEDELRNPVSAGALQLAYASARACFGRQIASGRSWRDVR